VNEYTARNGVKLEWDGDTLKVDTLAYFDRWGTHYPALAEFFRAEDDERLGRWRWPENPDYVVYAREDYVQVLHEADGTSGFLGSWTRKDVQFVTSDGNLMGRAALAYFDAHPESKPWHDAKAGEVWVVTIDGHSRPHYVEDNRGDTVGGVAFVAINPTHGQPGHVGINAPAVTDARRIYPQGDS
jgi:hypothetical protein